MAVNKEQNAKGGGYLNAGVNGDLGDRAAIRRVLCCSFESPGSRKTFLASRGGGLDQSQLWLGLVDLSRISSGTVFREVHPASEMGHKHRP